MPELDERVARLESRVEYMDGAVIAALSEMRSAFGAQLANHDKRFDGLERRFDGLETKVSRLDRKLNWMLAMVGPALALLLFEAMLRLSTALKAP